MWGNVAICKHFIICDTKPKFLDDNFQDLNFGLKTKKEKLNNSNLYRNTVRGV